MHQNPLLGVADVKPFVAANINVAGCPLAREIRGGTIRNTASYEKSVPGAAED